MTILLDTQRAGYAGDLVTLFELDCTDFADGTILHFTSTAYSTQAIEWNGNTFVPVEIEAEGFEFSGTGAFPTPTLRLSNVNSVASALVLTYGDLIGARLKRVRTFAQYLDNGATPDPLQIFPPDHYVVEQKVKHTRTTIEWKLAAAVDQQGVKLPSHQLVRDYCNRIFRKYDPVAGVMRYHRATCPYTGAYYDLENNSTSDPTKDACPKTLTGCEVRFGANNPLPFKGLPGLARFR